MMKAFGLQYKMVHGPAQLKLIFLRAGDTESGNLNCVCVSKSPIHVGRWGVEGTLQFLNFCCCNSPYLLYRFLGRFGR